MAVTAFPRLSTAELTITNHTDEALAVPRYLGWDMWIDGAWYQIAQTDEAHLQPEDGHRYPAIAPGESGTIDTLQCPFLPPLMPGRYRIYVSDDPAQGWVVEEFELTMAQIAAWELPVWMEEPEWLQDYRQTH